MFAIRYSLFALALLFAPPAFAHPAVSAVAIVKVDPSGRVSITLTHDALAFALNEQPLRIDDEAMYALLKGPREDLAAALADAKERLASGMRLTAAGSPVPFQLTQWPTPEAIDRWKSENPAGRLPVKLEFAATAQLPPGATDLSIQFPPALADVILMLDRPGVEPLAIPLGAGEPSPAVPPFPHSGVPSQTASDISQSRRADPSSTSLPSVSWRFIRRGFVHIIPHGPDHALFVLGLFLLVPRFKTVAWQITAFTAAHTVTLTLASLGLVSIKPGFIEPAIAATVAFVGIENTLTTRVHPWRIAVTFLFGLVHGLGVARDFTEAGFPPGQLLPSLAAFTVGVEAGHIAVLAAAFAALGWARAKPWYRARVALPLSLGIAAVALVWLVMRLRGG